MPGLVPGIHVFKTWIADKPGDDGLLNSDDPYGFTGTNLVVSS
jgi:hypothetical protein